MEMQEQPNIPIEDFFKVDIRVGEIISAVPVPKSEKLVKLDVFFGPEVGHRTIVAGIAKNCFYKVESLPGVHCLFVLNIEPRKIMGVESHGMILAGEVEPGSMISLAACPGLSSGTRIG